MILDTSVLVEITLDAPLKTELIRRIHRAEFAGAGTPTLVETGLVLTGCLGDAVAAHDFALTDLERA